MGSGGSKHRQGRCGGCCCCSKTFALPSNKVGEGAGGIGDALWYLAGATWISTPISSQPAGAISSTCHSELDSCLLTLQLGGGARGEDSRGRRQGHVGEAKEGKGGQLLTSRAQICSPICSYLAFHCAFPLALRWGTLQHIDRVGKTILLTKTSYLQKPDL